MTMPHPGITRRTFVGSLGATSAVLLAGCGRASKAQSGSKSASPPRAKTPASMSSMFVYRDPSCGCCQAWARIARDAGYKVKVIDHPGMPAIKLQYGVPLELRSCHTTIVGGYAIEGHVPLEDVQRLLKEKPAGIRGIAVAGMPLGSPGMEVPDGTKQPFQVMAFDADGRWSAFRG